VERPVGVAQEFTSDEDEVGLAGADDVRGLSGAGDHADGAGEDAGLGADGFREGRLIAGAEGMDAARREECPRAEDSREKNTQP